MQPNMINMIEIKKKQQNNFIVRKKYIDQK